MLIVLIGGLTVRAQESDDSLFSATPAVCQNPSARVPLIAIVQCTPRHDAMLSVEVDDGDSRWVQPSGQAEAGREQRIGVWGLSPATDYRLRIGLQTTGSGEINQQAAGHQSDAPWEWSEWLDYRTPDLPSSFPPLKVEVLQPAQVSAGVTLFGTNLWIDNKSMLDYGYIVAIDEGGRVVWFCNTEERIADLRILANGNLLYQHGNYRWLREMDWYGRTVRTWYASNLTEPPDGREANGEVIPVAVDTLHHDVIEMPNGNFLTLATELFDFDRFPGSEIDPAIDWGPARVVCDAIVEFQPRDGRIVQRFSLKNVLDPQRFGYMSLSGFWSDKYDRAGISPARDWSHANGLVYDPQTHTLVVSLRHLDCLLSLKWPSAELLWILGDHGGWGEDWQRYLLKPQGTFDWFYHPHSPKLTRLGILLYDNGNYRARPFDPMVLGKDNASRILEYAIDPSAMTVAQVSAIERFGGRTIYCPFYGEAEILGEAEKLVEVGQPGEIVNNLLITHGGHIESKYGEPQDDVPGERQWGEVLETSNDGRQVYLRAAVDSGLDSRYGWSIYRSLKLREPWFNGTHAPPIER